MAKDWAKSFYNNKKWINCRSSYISERIAIDGGLCEECSEELGYIVHHVVELTPGNIDNPDISLNHKNLEYVCKYCHDRKENHFIKAEELEYKFDKEGQILPL